MKKLTFIFLVIICIVISTNLQAQCAMCKASVESSQGQVNSVANGINKGILYLMAVPYCLLIFIFRKQLKSLWYSLRGKETVGVEE